MELDWLRVEPQNGNSGVHGIKISVLSENEGLDREKTIRSVCGGISSITKVRQSGKREIFKVSDGDFILSDGRTLNVLK